MNLEVREIYVHLQKLGNSSPWPKYLYIFILVQISFFWKFVLIKVFDYLTCTTVTGILNTGFQISFYMNYGLPPLYLPAPSQNSEG